MVAVACLGAELASGDMAQGNLSVKAGGGRGEQGEGVRGAFSALRQVFFCGVWQVVLLENSLWVLGRSPGKFQGSNVNLQCCFQDVLLFLTVVSLQRNFCFV